LQARLYLIVLIGLGAAVGLLLFTWLEAQRQAEAQAREQVMTLRRLVAEAFVNQIEASRAILSSLAEAPEVRAAGPVCSGFLAQRLAEAPGYANFVVAASDGQVTCSALAAPNPVNAADLPWFQRSVARQQFSVGDYELSRITGEPVLALSYPILDGNDVAGVIGAHLAVDRLGLEWLSSPLPTSAGLAIFDRNATVLASYPASLIWQGRSAANHPLFQAVSAAGQATQTVQGLDGVSRLYSFERLQGSSDFGLTLAVGLPMSEGVAPLDSALQRNLFIMGAVTLAVLGLAIFYGDRLLVRPVEAIAAVVGRLRGGDLSARVGGPGRQHELGRLAEEFNALADALQQREAERQEAEKRLRESEARYRALFTNAGDAVALADDQARFVEVNPAFARLVGYSQEELLSLSVPALSVGPPEAAVGVEPLWHRFLKTGAQAGEIRLRRKDGETIEVEYHAVANVLPGLHLSVLRDATGRKREERHHRLLAEAGQALASTLNYHGRLRALAHLLAPAVADWCAINVVEPDGSMRLAAAAHKDPQRTSEIFALAQRQPVQAGDATGAAHVLRSGQPLLVPGPDGLEPEPAAASDPASSQLGLVSYIIVPMTARGRILGAITLALSEPGRRYSPADLRLAEEIGGRAGLALDNARLYDEAHNLNAELERRVATRTQLLQSSLDEVRQSHAELRRLSARLQAAREEERMRIAREIHDQLGGALTGLKLDVVWLRRHMPPDQTRLLDKVNAVAALIDDTVKTVRRIATELRPSILDDVGLLAAVEWLAQDFQKRTGIPVHVEANTDDLNLGPDRSIAIYRAVQESLTNVARHAEATRVDIEIEDGQDFLSVSVRDNGRGLDEGRLARTKSLGLAGMRERVRAVGGEVEIRGRPGEGTQVTIHLPTGRAQPAAL
jgi:PAS domain S-box-containing protein